jgi:peptidoglycan/xylan/chitin deacetylase (PgdA/CDA1 family)
MLEGSEVANHSLHHEDGPGYSSIERTQELIEAASGYEPCAFRPPGGYEPSSTYDAAQALGLVSVIWDVDTRDWERPGAGTIYARATAAQPGSIVLMHDGGGDRSQTVEALPHIIENLKSRGYRLVTITRLLRGRYRYAEVHGHHDRRRPLPDPRSFPFNREGP